jgi:hypothetical protein
VSRVNPRGSAARIAVVPGLLESAGLQLRVAKRLVPRKASSLSERLGRLDDRLVFVVGSPRSGTTFLAHAIGSLPGFVDLGELAPLKAKAGELSSSPPPEAARRLRRLLAVSRRVGLVGSVRGVEQTPEVAFLLDAVSLAYPDARIVHAVRDGRDVVCSFLEKGWFAADRTGTDDAGIAFGAYPRFWVETDRRAEFAATSDARRAAWAWRRYASAARAAGARAFEVRYEAMVLDPASVARGLAAHLGVPPDALLAALGSAHAESVGRHERDLTADQRADVIAEAGALLRELGYLDAAT